jgi:prepilin-type N-terminal cleavage/methylation domain-containing protein
MINSPPSHCSYTKPGRSGMTLVEMLVAMAATLLLMSVVAQLFGVLGRTVSSSTNTQAMSAALRSASRLLRQDLNGITVDPAPPTRADQDLGYLEIIEGSAKDGTGVAADWDDALFFTATNVTEPFRGMVGGQTGFQSQSAEIAWFCEQSADQPLAPMGITLYTLYRRQLLTSAFVGQAPFLVDSRTTSDSWAAFYQQNDLSARLDGGYIYPNSLSDLTKRENRFLHGTMFPYQYLSGGTSGVTFAGTAREGDDIVLTNVIGFDVRVYDPLAPIKISGGVGVIPGDNGFSTNGTATARGAYVDMGWDPSLTTPISTTATFPPSGQSPFQGRGVSISNRNIPLSFSLPTYDTWSSHYETNGQDENGLRGVDEGSDGKDSNADGLVDEAAEQETAPPYPVRLKALEIRIRCCDPRSRQIKQVTVRHAFVPQ